MEEKETNENRKTWIRLVLTNVPQLIFLEVLRKFINDISLPTWLANGIVVLAVILYIVLFVFINLQGIKKRFLQLSCLKALSTDVLLNIALVVFLLSCCGYIIACLLNIMPVVIFRIIICTTIIFIILFEIVDMFESKYSLPQIIAKVFLFAVYITLFLRFTYIKNIYTYPINMIAKSITGESVLPELYIYDRSALGFYKSSGYGICTFQTKEYKIIYEGMFKNEQFSGQGKLTFGDSIIQEGEFTGSKLNGQGKITFADGTVWEGEFKDGKLNGQGKKNFADGTVWEGEFKNDKLNGQVKISIPNKAVFEGEFVNDNLNGQGKITFADGTVREGIFVDGILQINEQ